MKNFLPKIFLVVIAALLPIETSADVLPFGKPATTVYVDDTFQKKFSAKIFICSDLSCKDKVEFVDGGNYIFWFDVNPENRLCRWVSYSNLPFVILQFSFDGKIIESLPFEPDGNFDATLTDGKVVVSRRFLPSFLCLWCE